MIHPGIQSASIRLADVHEHRAEQCAYIQALHPMWVAPGYLARPADEVNGRASDKLGAETDDANDGLLMAMVLVHLSMIGTGFALGCFLSLLVVMR